MTPDIPFEINSGLIWDNPDGFRTVSGPDICDKARWVTYMRRVISDGTKYYSLEWEEGNTEYQDASDEVSAKEVWPHVVQVIEYKDTPNEV